MSETNSISPHWHTARASLLTEISGWLESDETEPLTLSLPDEDWLLEITPDSRLICVAGYDLDEIELAKQVKFFLQQTTSKYRRKLVAEGFVERIEMNDDFVAAHFEQNIDLGILSEVRHKIQNCQSWFRP
jgi:hypothetical protein